MMFIYLQLFFDKNFINSGYIYFGKLGIIRFEIASKLIISLSYLIISLLLLYVLRYRPNIPYQKIFWLFFALIMVCGATHLLELFALWYPNYGLSNLKIGVRSQESGVRSEEFSFLCCEFVFMVSSLFNAIAAGVTLFIAGKLAYLMPKVFALPNLLKPKTTNESALVKRERYLDALVKVQRRLLAFEKDCQQGFIRQQPYNEILKLLGEVSGATRVYVVENHRDNRDRLLMTQKAQWCAPGISWKINAPTLPNLPYEDIFPRWAKLLSKNEIIAGVVAEFPESERVILELQGIHSILVLPLTVNGMFFGFIGFDNCTESRPWQATEVDLLSSAAAAVSLWNESVLTQQALCQSERANRALLEAIPDALLRIRRDGTHLDFIPAKNSQMPIAARWFLGKKIAEVLPPELALKVSADVEAAFSTGKVQVSQVPIQLKGDLYHYEIRTVFYSEDEVLMMGRDVTEQKQAEAALRESEEQFRQLTENINEVFFLTAPDASKILYISPAYEDVWGRSTKTLYAQPKSWLDSVHLDDRDRIVAALTRHIQNLQDFVEEYRVVRPDGSVRWVWVRAVHILNPAGSSERIAGIAEDITERKLAEVEILNALAKEKELGDLKSRFISITSHEFRTPLATIMSTAELLEYYEWTKQEEVEQLHLIQEAVKHMLELLNDLLFIGTAEAGQVRLNPEPLLLNEFCQELVAEIQRGIGVNLTDSRLVHAVRFASQGESFLACLDKKLLRQLLGNLLSNAIKYSPEGGDVLFKLTCQDDKAIFEIQDRGIGIPREEQSRLFEFFYRAKNVGAIAGTGLGLAIVKTCVDLHRGEIAIHSEVGVGTRFTVSLPLKNDFSASMSKSLPLHTKQLTRIEDSSQVS